jgi:predicted SAM-dependent methyltransferase/GT2 family glycosyltransferase
VTFDLVVATIGRVEELERLFESLERQTHKDFRILLVDQNEDGRVEAVLAAHPSFAVERLRAPSGLSRARNVALRHVRADVVAFPDDDCVYADDLLERVARRLDGDPKLGGLTGRAPDSASWKHDAATLTRENLWNRAISFTIFLRREVVEQVGPFDEALGLPSSSGEEIDYLIRALDAGARIEYDPTLVVTHPEKERDPRAVGGRDGASIGYILRKHRYPFRFVAPMMLRPAGGAALAVVRGDRARAEFHASTLHGRFVGYRGAAPTPWVTSMVRSGRVLRGRIDRRKLIDAYLRSHAVRKLHLGAGENVLPGWLNTDASGWRPENVVYLNARKPFPLPDSSIDAVFSEHMLEHLTYTEGQACLRECLRVLRPGSRIRIATPALDRLAGLYDAEPTEVQRRYVRWAVDTLGADGGAYLPGFVVNNFVRAWGHQFIYDEQTLRHALATVGFVDVARRPVGESDDPKLTGLERHLAEAPEFNEYETLVLEARRP